MEWVSLQPGAGASTLALLTAKQACLARSGDLAVVDPDNRFYPPAAAAWGIDLQRVIWIQPSSKKDLLWAVDQCLRCSGLSAILAWVDAVDSHTFRRWQLAAEQSGALGCLLRPEKAQLESSWADLRLGVSPLVDSGPPGLARASPTISAPTIPPPAAPMSAIPMRPPPSVPSPPAPASPQAPESWPVCVHYQRRMTLHVLHRRGGGFFSPIHLTVSHENPKLQADIPLPRGVCVAAQLGHPTGAPCSAEAS